MLPVYSRNQDEPIELGPSNYLSSVLDLVRDEMSVVNHDRQEGCDKSTYC